MLDPTTINSLIQAAKSGNAEAFGDIYDQFVEAIYRFIRFRVSDAEEAQDLTQQVFLEAWQSLPRFQIGRSFPAWIFAIARFKVIDYYRRHRSTADIDTVTDLASPTDLLSDTDTRLEVQKVLAALEHLPENYRTIVELRLVHDLDYAEISHLVGKSETTLRVAFKRGLDKLRSYLDS